jgi:hypothetical protein
VVAVVLDGTLLGGLTVVNGGLDLRLDKVHSSDDTTHGDELVDKSSVQATRSNVILTKVTFKADIVLGYFLGESFISLINHLLFGVLPFSSFVLHVLDSVIKLLFKHSDGLDGVLLDIVS